MSFTSSDLLNERIILGSLFSAVSFCIGYKLASSAKPNDGDFSLVSAGWTEPCKMVLVVRTDANLSTGTICELCGTATLACYKALTAKNPQLAKHWEMTGQAKIALKAKNVNQILDLEAKAKSLNLCARNMKDPNNPTVPGILAIGPAPVSLINQVTGKLRLF
ncbi:peptidyl-tRNA hydrolase PTH2-domain-containing protein [Flagelloscypha sp. PMI_526]|nr:peptidyl-tRNA hydrolase PTH2-domain-containing protein [Flagelloscypha sp. PMI_526]